MKKASERRYFELVTTITTTTNKNNGSSNCSQCLSTKVYSLHLKNTLKKSWNYTSESLLEGYEKDGWCFSFSV